MGKVLGTRCPECGTETAPQVILAISPHAETQWIAVCPRCGHQACAELAVHALEDFYGPQKVAQPATPSNGWARVMCAACYGTGRYGDNGSLVCPACHGAGFASIDDLTGQGRC